VLFRSEEFKEINKLIEEENHTKLKQLQQDLEVQKSVLDKRQLAYKVNANSMYGALGAAKGYLPFVNGAMAVTYIGRISIEKAVNYIKNNWDDALVVYGDTDYCFINFKRFEDHTHERFSEINILNMTTPNDKFLIQCSSKVRFFPFTILGPEFLTSTISSPPPLFRTVFSYASSLSSLERLSATSPI
jgi:hypothetical protein